MTRIKRITKKKLKEPDEFISVTERVYLFVTHHGKPIAAGAVIVLIVLASIFIYQRWQKKTEEEGSGKFSQAAELYEGLSSPNREATAAEYKSVLGKFDEVITGFPGTLAGKTSILYKGNIQLRLGEFEDAIKSYQTFLEKAGKRKLYHLFALEGLGYAYEGKKDYAKAVEAYQKIIEEGDHFGLSDAYLNAGRCYEKLGKKKEALESYKGFLKVAQNSIMTNGVLRRISILEN